MGFTKRYISKKSLETAKKRGLNYFINYITKPDSLIIEDSFSNKICDIVLSKTDVKQKLEKIGFSINE
jgi:hypothetical protein